MGQRKSSQPALDPDILGRMLFEAAESGDSAMLKQVLGGTGGSEAQVLNWANPLQGGQTPLIAACQMGEAACVKALLSYSRVDVNQASHDHNWTPLFFACKHAHADCVKLLLAQRGIDTNKAEKLFSAPL